MKTKSPLFLTHPWLLDEFDQEKHPGVDFRSIGRGSDKKYFWRCKEGHTWDAAASSRAAGQGCPYCSGRRRLVGATDFLSLYPKLASEIHPSLNLDLDPSQTSPKSSKRVTWQCTKNPEHIFVNSVHKRVIRNQGCPYCANKKVLLGDNDLSSVFPAFAEQWDWEKNVDCRPDTVTAFSQKLVWWICESGHSFSSRISYRTRGGAGCPYCSGRYPVIGVNDLTITHPHRLSLWDSDKNPLGPENFLAGSDKKVWWVCRYKHSFLSSIHSVAMVGTGCPYCSGNKILPGFNDLLSHPGLSEELDLERNERAEIKLDSIHSGSHKKVWWKCIKGHSWSASPDKRTRGRGCPRCSMGGFDSTKQGYVYFLSNPLLRAMKVGITNFDSARLDSFVALGWLILWKSDLLSGEECRQTELEFFRWVRIELGLPKFLTADDMGRVGGYSETFSGDLEQTLVIDRLIEIIESVPTDPKGK